MAPPTMLLPTGWPRTLSATVAAWREPDAGRRPGNLLVPEGLALASAEIALTEGVTGGSESMNPIRRKATDGRRAPQWAPTPSSVEIVLAARGASSASPARKLSAGLSLSWSTSSSF